MKLLQDTRIVECATYVAAPSVGMALARLGAEVLRVDHRRRPLAPGGASLYWTGLNKGKRSLAVDLRSLRGQEMVTALITQPGMDCGVLLDNTVGWNWLAHDRLRALRPDLVHVRVQGKPDGGAALDYTANAAAGVLWLTGTAGSTDPVNHQLPAWDLLTGSQAVNAVLAGLLQRSATGAGSDAEIALTDVALGAVADLGWPAEAELTGRDRQRLGNQVYGSFGDAFRTADDEHVMVVAMTRKQWHALRVATGTVELFDRIAESSGLDLDVEEHRYKLREVLGAVLARWFAAAQREAPGPLLGAVEQPGIGEMLGARGALRWPGAAQHGEPIAPAPELGADIHLVLTEQLGLDATELRTLIDKGVIS